MIKRKNLSNVLILLVLLLVNGCMGKGDKEDVFAPEQLINKDSFIDATRGRAEETAKYGPTLNLNDGSSSYEVPHRTAVDKENPLDYTRLQDDGKANDFPIDLNIENMDIRTFAKLLSKVTGVNILTSDEVAGNVSVKLHDVPWTSALDSVLEMKGLAKHVDTQANIIRIHSQQTIIALEEFERNRREALQKSAQLDQAAEPLFTEIFKLYYTQPKKLKETLDTLLGVGDDKETTTAGMRDTAAKIIVDDRKNSLIVKARGDDIKMISKLVDKMDTPTRQVFIEAFILEVTDDFADALGVRLGGNFSDDYTGGGKRYNVSGSGLAGVPTTAVTLGDSGSSIVDLPVSNPMGGLGLAWGIGSTADLKVELTAMEKKGLSKIISNPRIFTLDNQEAVIFQGSEIPYETVSQNGTQIQFKDAGLKLAVTPTVVGDGNLMLSLVLNKDTADTTQTNPPITKSQITTNLVTKDNSIVAIGGIYTQTKSDTASKVPALGDMPLAGKLFRRDEGSNGKKELVIFIAPHIL